MCQALPYINKESVSIVHQTGPSDYDRVNRLYAEQEFPARIVEYIPNMPTVFAETDLVVSRS